MKELHQAIAEVLEAYFTPDSPEALACAIYQLRKVYKKYDKNSACKPKQFDWLDKNDPHHVPCGCYDG